MTAMGKSKNNLKKKKHSKKSLKKGKKEFKPTGKRGRLIIRNLSFKCNEDELHDLFKRFGDIKDVQLLRRPNKQPVGCGFVEFTSRLNADRAVNELNGSQFLGRPLYVERAVARDRYDETSVTGKDTSKDDKNESDSEEDEGEEDEIDDEIKEEPSSDVDESDLKTQEIKEEKLSSDEEEEIGHGFDNKKRPIQNSNHKARKNMKKGRLIVRNLSFKTTVDKMIEHFSPYGEVMEVKLLHRPDNTLVGCGFVQYAKKSSAAKAIHHTSGKPFLGRPIIVDWAVAKDKFKKMQDESLTKEIKKESDDDEDNNTMDTSNVTIKKEEESDEETEEESESEKESKASSSEEEEDESDEDDKSEVKHKLNEASQRRRVEDVDEGRTVFVKNLPFSVDDDEFRDCMKQFGPVFYALVCKDKLTDRSKGSGFVKFKNKEDAEKCLNSGTELQINGTTLDPHPALKRAEAEKLRDKTKEKKDNRNLYLVKEGLIIAGTPAAKGVSVSDMEKRLQLEQWKNTRLRNLNMFVSNNRLVVHNVPATLSDNQFRKLFLMHAGSKAIIKEARIMRDLKRVDDKGQGASKGYGFVSFEKHEDALTALRKINNNPDVFTPAARPIVSFSIENRAVLNIKTKRLERSRQKNPLCKEYKAPEEEEGVPAKKVKHTNYDKHNEQKEPQFAGMVAKPGGDTKMRKKHKLKNQAAQHLQDVKQQKRENKSRKQRRAEHVKKKQFERKSMKKNKKVDNDEGFTKLVDKYKTKLLSQSSEKKKWYDE